MIDSERLQEIGCLRKNARFETAKAHLQRPRLHTRTVEYFLEAHTLPQGIAHGTVRPLPPRHARTEKAARISRALVDGGHLDRLELANQLLEREGDRLSNVTVDLEPKCRGIDDGRNIRQVPTHEKAIVGGEDALVEHFERGL